MPQTEHALESHCSHLSKSSEAAGDLCIYDCEKEHFSGIGKSCASCTIQAASVGSAIFVT
jgi:hypothetical protein